MTRLNHTYTLGRALEVDYNFFGKDLEKKGLSKKIRVSSYRYVFNGKEKDPEGLGGGQSTYDYGFRIYNPALGKFLSVDPLTKSYPWYTPYQFAGNKPIAAIDLDGLEELIVIRWFDDLGKYAGESSLLRMPTPLREIGKRRGNDQQTIEMNVSLRSSINKGDYGYIASVIKNENGTFKGTYKESIDKINNNNIEDLRGGKDLIRPTLSPNTVLFEYNTPDIRVKMSEKQLTNILGKLDADPDRKIMIFGYASEEGDEKANKSLSENRADALKDYLIKNGVAPDRIISTMGKGETGNSSNRETSRKAEIIYTYEKKKDDN